MSESFRTKDSVEAGITTDLRFSTDVRVMDYQPGNGTRYSLVFTRLPADEQKSYVLGCSGGECWLVSLMNCTPKVRTIISTGGRFTLRWTEIACEDDGFGIGYNDAVCLTEIICHVTGLTCDPVEKMTEEANKRYREEQKWK